MLVARRPPVSSRWQRLAAGETPQLPLVFSSDAALSLEPCSGPRAIEDGGFPFETLSDIAETESWRRYVETVDIILRTS